MQDQIDMRSSTSVTDRAVVNRQACQARQRAPPCSTQRLRPRVLIGFGGSLLLDTFPISRMSTERTLR